MTSELTSVSKTTGVRTTSTRDGVTNANEAGAVTREDHGAVLDGRDPGEAAAVAPAGEGADAQPQEFTVDVEEWIATNLSVRQRSTMGPAFRHHIRQAAGLGLRARRLRAEWGELYDKFVKMPT